MESHHTQEATADQSRMSVQEAESVMALYSRLQEQNGSGIRPTVADMAEALGIPQAEVQVLLGQVRNEAPPVIITQPEVREFPRKIFFAAIGGIACLVFLMLISATWIKFLQTKMTSQQFAPPPGIDSATAIEDASFGPATMPAEFPLENVLPEGTIVMLGDYKVIGKNPAASGTMNLEEQIFNGLQALRIKLYDQVENTAPSTPEAMKAFQEALIDKKVLKGVLTWEEVSVNGKDSFKTSIPVLIGGSSDMVHFVSAEQERAFKILANRASLQSSVLDSHLSLPR